MKRIVICPDKSHGVGIGHVKRCESLHAHASVIFESKFLPVDFSSREASEIISQASEKADMVLFDTHQKISHIITGIQKPCRSIVLDNFHEDERDLGLNVLDHENVKNRKSVTDLNFIIVRNEVLLQINKKLKSEDYAVVAIGGGDVLGMGPKIIDTLKQITNMKIYFILGPHAKAFEANTVNVEVLRNPGNFVEILAKASFVMCNAGGTLFEALLLGKPSVVFPQTRYEENIAKSFLEKKLILSIGIDDLANDLVRSHNFSRGPLPFDGKGAELIVKHIGELL